MIIIVLVVLLSPKLALCSPRGGKRGIGGRGGEEKGGVGKGEKKSKEGGDKGRRDRRS